MCVLIGSLNALNGRLNQPGNELEVMQDCHVAAVKSRVIHPRLRGESARRWISPNLQHTSSRPPQPTNQPTTTSSAAAAACVLLRAGMAFFHRRRRRRKAAIVVRLPPSLAAARTDSAGGFWQQIPFAKRSDVSPRGNKGIKVDDGRTALPDGVMKRHLCEIVVSLTMRRGEGRRNCGDIEG